MTKPFGRPFSMPHSPIPETMQRLARTEWQAVRSLLTDFMQTSQRRALLITAALAAVGLLEGLSIASMLSVLIAASNSADGLAIPAVAYLGRGLDAIGLPQSLEVLIGLIFGLLALKAGLGYWAVRQVALGVSDVAAQMRLRLMRAVLAARWSYFTSKPGATFTNAMSGEADRSAQAFEALSQIIACLVQIAVYLALVILISWRVALLSAVAALALSGLLRRLSKLDRDAGRKQTQLFKALAVRVADGLRGIKPLKAMAREASLERFLVSLVGELNATLRRGIIGRRIGGTIAEPAIAIVLVVAIYAGRRFLDLEPVVLLVLAGILFRILTRVGHIQQCWQTLLHEESAYHSLKALLLEAEGEAERHAGRETPLMPSLIELIDVDFRYDDKPLLDRASALIRPGEITAIIGPSGVGKSTLAELLLGLMPPRAGEIRVGGRPLSELDIRKWRAMVGYVPQETVLFSDTIEANISLGDPEVSSATTVRALEQAGALAFVEALPNGLGSHVGENGLRLSGGERQRLAIARALVKQPALLILDEATNALDYETELAICSTVSDLSASMSVLVITHQPAWLSVANSVYQMSDGALTRVTSHVPAGSRP